MTPNLLRRGNTFYARLTIPEDRWGDVGQAMKATGGLKREIVRTLQTTDRREAQRRVGPALHAIRQEVDSALLAVKLKPLTDWTANWPARALERREQVLEGRRQVVQTYDQDEDGGSSVAVVSTAAELIVSEIVEREAEELERRRGEKAAAQYLGIVTKEGLTVAEAARKWLAEQHGTRRNATLRSHEKAFERLQGYLTANEGLPPLEALGLADVTRRMAGEFVAWRRSERAVDTVGKDHAAFSGLWRWAVRRGYTEANPWLEQLTGLKAAKGQERTGEERAYTSGEIVKLLHAGQAELAPGRGGYAATFWDVMRLALLTGARANEILGLRCGDVIEDGAAIAVAATGRGGKTDNAPRVIPLHNFARQVVRGRLASLPDKSEGAPLWPEVPAQGPDQRRSKLLATRFPDIRRRILGPDDGADFHSFRRTFLTACETARHAGGRLNPELIALLAGQKRGTLALDLYSDWSKMGKRKMTGGLGEKLATLQAAVDDAVNLGMAPEVLTALEETSGQRPAVVRTAPAFRRLLVA